MSATIGIHPITAADLAEVAGFWHRHLNPRLMPTAWEQALHPPWFQPMANHGFCLRHAGQVVGALGVIYAIRRIHGREELFGNLTSWCVLEPYRHRSLELLLAVVSRPDCHYTVFTLKPELARIFMALRFRAISGNEQAVPNFPMVWPTGNKVQPLRSPEEEMARLPEVEARLLADHLGCLGWRFVVLASEGDGMLVVYRPVRRWRLPCAEILYLGDRSRLVAVGRALAGHLLGQGLVVSLFPARWSLPIPGMHREIPRTQPLLVRSSLADGDMDLLYSEIATMGL